MNTTLKNARVLRFAMALIASSFMFSAAQAQICKIDFDINGGCDSDGTGWAEVSNVVWDGGSYTVSWSNGATGNPITGLSDGIYTATVEGFNKCVLSKSVTIECEKPEEDTCMFRTQTPGGWGAPPNGNNPGAYLHANFASCFPNGLTIGCTNTLVLNSAQDVTNFLPSGGQPALLPAGSLVNPTNYGNVYAGHLTALTLSVAFDACDPNFSPGSITLGEATLLSGMFAGWTVQELLDESNNSIGGCGSSYNRNKLKSALAMVNENYVDGNMDKGNVGCEEEEPKSLINNSTELSIYPNPASDLMTLELMTSSTGLVEVAIMDVTGRVVLPARSISVKADMLKQINLDVSDLQNGTYLVTVLAEGSITSTTIMVTE